MVESFGYVPVLPIKAGEMTALRDLPSADKVQLTPLFVVTTGPEATEEDRWRPPEELLDTAVAEVARCWGRAPFFVDLRALGDESVAPGVHPLLRFLETARQYGLATVPVTGLSASIAQRLAVRDAVLSGGQGFCLRVPRHEWAEFRAGGSGYQTLEELDATPGDVDLVLDFAGTGEAADTRSDLSRPLEELSDLSLWRSLIVTGTSYPSPRRLLRNGITEWPRQEWLRYERLASSGAAGRLPTLGDYGVTHPDAFQPPPYVLDVRATLRYTTSDTWLIARGDLYSSRSGGAGVGGEAIPPLARELLAHPHFGLSQHCRMERWVSVVAHVNRGGGNPSLWHRHATNHHMVRVSEQLARLHGTGNSVSPDDIESRRGFES